MEYNDDILCNSALEASEYTNDSDECREIYAKISNYYFSNTTEGRIATRYNSYFHQAMVLEGSL